MILMLFDATLYLDWLSAAVSPPKSIQFFTVSKSLDCSLLRNFVCLEYGSVLFCKFILLFGLVRNAWYRTATAGQ